MKHTDRVPGGRCTSARLIFKLRSCPGTRNSSGPRRANPGLLRRLIAREPDSAVPPRPARLPQTRRTCRRRTPATRPTGACTVRQFDRWTWKTHHVRLVCQKRLIRESRTGAEHLTQIRCAMCEASCFCGGRRGVFSCGGSRLSRRDDIVMLVLGRGRRAVFAARRKVEVDRVRGSRGGRHLGRVRTRMTVLTHLIDHSPTRETHSHDFQLADGNNRGSSPSRSSTSWRAETREDPKSACRWSRAVSESGVSYGLVDWQLTGILSKVLK